MSDRSLIVAIVAVGVSLCGVILFTDDGAKIDALGSRLNLRIDRLDARIDKLDDKLDAKIGALDARIDKLDDKIVTLDARIDKLDAKIGTLDAKIGTLDAKIDDIRVYIAAKHGERISFRPGQVGSQPTWTVHEVDAATGKLLKIGTLEVRDGPERRAVLRIEGNKLTREWAHLGNADTLDRARALTNMALAQSDGG